MTLSDHCAEPDREKAKGKAAKVDLPADIFDVKTNIPLIHQVVVAQLAAARAGTHKAKTRGEVRGGGKKPYRQKGTGRARQGSTRAPQFVGGGVVHGPVPRDYSQRTPKKMKRAALRGALSDRARNDRVHVVSSLVAGDAPSAKAASATLAKVSTAKHVLVVAERTDDAHLAQPAQRHERAHPRAGPAEHLRRADQRRRRVHARRARRVHRRPEEGQVGEGRGELGRGRRGTGRRGAGRRGRRGPRERRPSTPRRRRRPSTPPRSRRRPPPRRPSPSRRPRSTKPLTADEADEEA